MATIFFQSAGICLSGTILGPSESASSGLGCVSIKSPSTPTAVAAFARDGANRPSPPDESPWPPGD